MRQQAAHVLVVCTMLLLPSPYIAVMQTVGSHCSLVVLMTTSAVPQDQQQADTVWCALPRGRRG